MCRWRLLLVTKLAGHCELNNYQYFMLECYDKDKYSQDCIDNLFARYAASYEIHM